MDISKINKDNIKSFVQGNYRYFLDKFLDGIKPHIKEQVAYRLSVCSNDCVPQGKCVYCECPPEKKAFVKRSCNKGERFPNLLDEEEWEAFKKDNNINEEHLRM